MSTQPETPASSEGDDRLRGTGDGITSREARRLLDLALDSLRNNDLAAACSACERARDLAPDDPEVLCLLGELYRAAGQVPKAVKVLERAAELAPAFARPLVVLGHLHRDAQHLGRAAECYRQALARDERLGEAWGGLGVVSHHRGNFREAVEAYRRALAIDDRNPELRFNLGVALQMLELPVEAEAEYRAALELDASHVRAWLNLGNLLWDRGELDAAYDSYEHGLHHDPDNADLCFKLGYLCKQRSRWSEAVNWYERALSKDPQRADVLNNLGNALKALGEGDRAGQCFERAVALQPASPEAQLNLGIWYRDQKRLSEARECFERVLDFDARHGAARVNLLLVGQDTCDWTTVNRLSGELIDETEQAQACTEQAPLTPFMTLSLPVSARFQQQVASNFARNCVANKTAATGPLFRVGRETPPKLRIGYVSPNFRNHPTSHLMVQLFELHDKDRFEIIAYSNGPDDGSEYRRRIERACDRFVDIRRESVEQTAERIAADGVHILVDRAGYTQRARSEIFSLRPAPIQVNYIGFPGTLGAEFIDYIVTDPVVTPPGAEEFFTEQPAYLPDCYLVTDSQPVVSSSVPSRSECGLPEDGFVFCSFNNNFKIEPTRFDLWMNLLRQVPGSVLWLLRASPEAEANLRREAERRGIDRHRLVFADRCPKAQHLARHRLADLFLDTRYYNAHTTAVDALYMGLPVVTLAGETFASRVCASVLTAAGLPELIAYSAQQYESLALGLARSPEALAALRQRVGGVRDSALFDTARYARGLERAYIKMWQRHARGLDPAPIDVATLPNQV